MHHSPDAFASPSSLRYVESGRVHPEWPKWEKAEIPADPESHTRDGQLRLAINLGHLADHQVQLPNLLGPGLPPQCVPTHSFEIGHLPSHMMAPGKVALAIQEHREAHAITDSYKRDSNEHPPTVPVLLNALLASPGSYWRSFNGLGQDPDGCGRFSVARRMAGLSQGHISKKLSISRSGVSRHESGEELFSIEVIERCEDVLCCVPAEPGNGLRGRWLMLGSHVRWWDVEDRIPVELDTLMSAGHPLWARRWIRPFAEFMSHRQDQILTLAQGMECLPTVSENGAVIMQAFAIQQVRLVASEQRLVPNWIDMLPRKDGDATSV